MKSLCKEYTQDKVIKKNENNESLSINTKNLQIIAFVIIGVVLVINGLSNLLGNIYKLHYINNLTKELSSMNNPQLIINCRADIIKNITKLILGVLLMLFGNKLVFRLKIKSK